MPDKKRQMRLRRVFRPFGMGLFSGLLVLAIAIAIMSFLTACKCMEPFVPVSR